MRLVDERQAAGNVARVLPEQDAQIIFLFRDLPLQVVGEAAERAGWCSGDLFDGSIGA